MKILLRSYGYVALYHLIFSLNGNAQPPVDAAATAIIHRLPEGNGLFETDKVLEVTLKGNIRELINDRAEKSKYHSMLFLYKEDKDGNEIPIPVEIKTRGHFRKLKKNCFYPPLLIHFLKTDSLKYSVFNKQDKLKLVMPCWDDQYIVKEWLVYKLYNLVTQKSFRTRLLRLKLEDTKKKKVTSSLYAILLEPEKQMAKRNRSVIVTRKIQPWQTESNAFLTMAVFEYLVGNTDWSIQYLQNIRLIAEDSNAAPIAVPYDFDHAGLVNAPYARPADELLMRSVLERRYRGYCVHDMTQFEQVIVFYNQLKKDIYNVYINCALLDARNIKNTLQYLDEFYKTINDRKQWQKEFSYPCDENGTGNVLIKGIRED